MVIGNIGIRNKTENMSKVNEMRFGKNVSETYNRIESIEQLLKSIVRSVVLLYVIILSIAVFTLISKRKG